MSGTTVAAVLATALVLLGASPVRGGEPSGGFPFAVPPDGLAEGSAPALLARPDAPAGAEGFVAVKGDRFVLSASGRPIRFWGTNLCFAGNFPPHDVAERMARRLATLGINCVRFHHMDSAPFPRGIWAGSGWGDFPHESLSPEALDRLDYLVAQLKQQGIYADLNLHVSRVYGTKDGFPAVGEGESVPKNGKGVDTFYPKAVGEQRRYAEMLLRHVNAYTGNAYAEEPAVAMIEINNEDGLLREWAGGNLDHLPYDYAQELERQWNAWLARHYGSTDEMQVTWREGEVAGSDENLLAAPGVQASLQTLGEARAEVQQADPAGLEGRIVVSKASPTTWHVQRIWQPLTVRKGVAYALRLRLRANREARVSVNCMMDHEPWRALGLRRTITVTPQWQDHEFYFTATADDAPDAQGSGGARVTLSGLSQPGLEVWFDGVSLVEAAVEGLMAGEELGAVRWPSRAGLLSRTPMFRREVVRFLRDTEGAYWKGMRDYLHQDLGVRMPVTGTAVGYTTPHLAAETVDFVDSHAYWQHPRFPGRPWDRDNWIVRNDAMVNSPARSTIATLAARRVFGRPYTITEYNQPQPHRYAAEAFPLIAVYGSFQGWDGLFEFAYSHNDQWETDHFASFFDMKANPVKLALMPACADILKKGGVGPPAASAAGRLSLDQRLELLAAGPQGVNAYGGGVEELAWQRARVGVLTDDDAPPPPAEGAAGRVAWEQNEAGGFVTYTGRSCAGLIGFVEGRTVSAGGLSLTPGPTGLGGFSVVMLNSAEGQALGAEGRYLITAVSQSWNRDMGWNAERNSVGRNWGRGPTLCEGVPVTLRAEVDGPVRLYALNPDGTRGAAVPAKRDGTGFELGPGYRTLWYELIIGKERHRAVPKAGQDGP